MDRLASAVKALFKDEEGATMVEYALVIVFVALVAVLGLTPLGTALKDKFTGIGTTVSTTP